MKKYLGIDWGWSKVGLAVADEEVRIAYVLEVLVVKDAGKVVAQIAQIVELEGVTDVVVGVPTSQMHGNDGQQVRKFVAGLRKLCGSVSFHETDEMFSTAQAKRNLMDMGKSTRQSADDALAAQVLLQSWLDANCAKC